jgi:2-keto-4-pentenoate hydratase
MQRTAQPRTYTYSHNNIDYSIEVNIQDDSMDLKIDDVRSGEGWKNSFSSKYIVEVTEKAGRPTTYNQFSHWLQTAL